MTPPRSLVPVPAIRLALLPLRPRVDRAIDHLLVFARDRSDGVANAFLIDFVAPVFVTGDDAGNQDRDQDGLGPERRQPGRSDKPSKDDADHLDRFPCAQKESSCQTCSSLRRRSNQTKTASSTSAMQITTVGL